ncbi:MAG: bifunctional 3-hydroxydecanoyl-ACP dehydratase/trans-2-decenoyl-ACP isomerase [Desulfosalsimonadaceae bacterium]|nr:bifunctional 3-hydroxydecanoyl-ACP dehydratase/trans-2-decenoyl-ACP isomerase [Desulfosalsimonadaceae bacterium]
MKYNEFLAENHFDFESLLAFSYGRLIEDPPQDFDARLPAPPFLMMDRILSITKKGSRGRVVAEQDIRLDAWYFQCHFPGDPVQPGCLCVDAIWQLMGFYCVWCGALGAGRALGCGEVAFNGQIRPHNRVARFEIDILRFQELKQAGSSVVIADAQVFVDDESITTVKQARTGIFKGITYKGYPLKTPNYLGGTAKT